VYLLESPKYSKRSSTEQDCDVRSRREDWSAEKEKAIDQSDEVTVIDEVVFRKASE